MKREKYYIVDWCTRFTLSRVYTVYKRRPFWFAKEIKNFYTKSEAIEFIDSK